MKIVHINNCNISKFPSDVVSSTVDAYVQFRTPFNTLYCRFVMRGFKSIDFARYFCQVIEEASENPEFKCDEEYDNPAIGESAKWHQIQLSLFADEVAVASVKMSGILEVQENLFGMNDCDYDISGVIECVYTAFIEYHKFVYNGGKRPEGVDFALKAGIDDIEFDIGSDIDETPFQEFGLLKDFDTVISANKELAPPESLQNDKKRSRSEPLTEPEDAPPAKKPKIYESAPIDATDLQALLSVTESDRSELKVLEAELEQLRAKMTACVNSISSTNAAVREGHHRAIRKLQSKYYDVPVYVHYDLNKYPRKLTKIAWLNSFDENLGRRHETRLFGRMDDAELEVLFPLPDSTEVTRIAQVGGYYSD